MKCLPTSYVGTGNDELWQAVEELWAESLDADTHGIDTVVIRVMSVDSVDLLFFMTYGKELTQLSRAA